MFFNVIICKRKKIISGNKKMCVIKNLWTITENKTKPKCSADLENRRSSRTRRKMKTRTMNKFKRIFPEQSINTQKEIFCVDSAPRPSERLSKTQCKSMGISCSKSPSLPPLPPRFSSNPVSCIWKPNQTLNKSLGSADVDQEPPQNTASSFLA